MICIIPLAGHVSTCVQQLPPGPCPRDCARVAASSGQYEVRQPGPAAASPPAAARRRPGHSASGLREHGEDAATYQVDKTTPFLIPL